jgi:MoxR-like ATPase
MERPGSGAAARQPPSSIDALQQALAAERYIADRGLAVSAFLALTLGRPLFLEGEAGVGKTEVAKALAAALGADLIRLQCYEGLDAGHAVYEWDYARQLLEIRLLEAAHVLDPPPPDGAAAAADPAAPARARVFSQPFLIKRPLLRALESAGERPTVLLIDEIDRADDEFEGYLLEFLSDFQVTIPELGTIRAATPPVVILTSNRTREVHDALKRRCLYLWIDYPDFDKELRILEARLPGVSAQLAEQVTAFVQELRRVELYKVPGISETLDWAAALVALDRDRLDAAVIDETLGLLLKYREDVQAVRGARTAEVLSRALARGVRQSG